MKKLVLAAPLAALSLGACATVTRGTSTAFEIQTTPIGAKATTSLGVMCEPTPCVIPKVSREAEFTVTLEKEGYKTTTHNVSHKTAGSGGAGMAGNVLLGGIIGAAIDGNNGATQDLVPNPLVVTLEKLEPVVAEAPAEAVAAAEEVSGEALEGASEPAS